MKAAIRRHYGAETPVTLEDVPEPTARPDEVVVRVRAVSLNASDWESLVGSPAYVRIWGLFSPRYPILGSDIAGDVVAVGSGVTQFKVGDAVFGDILGRWGGLAEFAAARASELSLKPTRLTYEQAAALPQAGCVALQGLRHKGALKPGQRVLIQGAGGGAGTFAIQLAKGAGAHVTAVDATEKLELMTALGADEVIDFTREDFTAREARYDRVLDLVGARSLADNARVLSKGGRYVMVGGSVPRLLQTLLLGPLYSLAGRNMSLLAAKPNEGTIELAKLIEGGTVSPSIDKVFPLADAGQALRYLGTGRALGKVVVTPRAAKAG